MSKLSDSNEQFQREHPWAWAAMAGVVFGMSMFLASSLASAGPGVTTKLFLSAVSGALMAVLLGVMLPKIRKK
jgi:hypothetical protein